MPLLEDAVYLAPDGRLFRAKLEVRRFSFYTPAWALLPLDATALPGESWRDGLTNLLFLVRDRIIGYEFDGLTLQVHETGWTPDDLMALGQSGPS